MRGQPCSVQPPLGSSRSRGSLLGAGITAPPSLTHSAPSAVTEVQQHTLTRKPPREYMPCSVAHARHCRCIAILSVVHTHTHTHTHTTIICTCPGGSRDVSDAVILDITCGANLALFNLLWVAPEVEEVSSEQAPQHLPAPPTLHHLQ